MKKRLLICISVLWFIAGLNDFLQAQPQYYNYNTAGSANSFPFNVPAGKDVQLLYLPGDFNQPSAAPAGNITSIAFRINEGYPLGPWTYTEFTIKLGQASITDFTPGSFYSGNLTTVYYRASVSLTGAAGNWMTITLDTPFPYDPTQSLIVDVGQCSATGATGYSSCFTTLSGNRRCWSNGGCPFTVYSTPNSTIYHFGLNLQTSGPPVVVTTAATSVTGTSATLNGTVNANGASTTVTFNYGLTTAYGSTIAGVPGSVTGSTVNPVTAALTGLLPGNTYHFRVSGTNSSGTTNGNDMTFLTPAVAPTVTTTAAAPVYGTMATLNGTVNAGGASTTVTFEYGTTIAYGSIASAAQSPVTGNITTSVSADLSGLALSTLYHFRAKGVNSVATVYGADMSFTTLNCNSPGNPGTISGSASVCVNSSGKVYSVPVITNATGYVWTVPAGAVITAGANTNTITVTFGAASGNVSVYGTSAACGNGPVSTLAVAVNPVPVPSITGQNSLCVNSGNFTYSTQAGQTAYTWVVSSGGTILNGTGSSQITVAWTVAGAQTVSINYTTLAGCSASSPTVLPVTVNGIPSAAGSISGTSVVCVGTTGVAYSVGTIPNALSYVWTLPTGASIASGSGTNAITVNFGTNAVSGNITVLGNNLCGNGPASTFAVTVNPYPAAAGVITGVGTVCQGQTGVGYMISPVTNASGYTWTVPSGATITAGGNTTLIDVSFSSSASSGIVSVVPVNSCGNGTASPNFPVTVNVTPPSPVITLNGDGFTSSAAAGNQWYRYLTLIPGATAQVYVPTQAGLYTDQVSLNGCASNMSNAIYFSATGIAENSNIKGFEVYPNPNAGEFTLTVSAQQQENYDVVLYSTLGVKVFEMKNISSLAPKTIDLRPVTSGVYLIVLQNNTTHIAKRITVE